MAIVASNCIRFNMSMDFWLLKDYTADSLLENWNEIFDFAKGEKSEENSYFLEDCMDVLYEKVLTLTDHERGRVLDKAKHDMDSYGTVGRIGVA